MGRYQQFAVEGGAPFWALSMDEARRMRPNKNPQPVSMWPRSKLAVAPREVVRVEAYDPARHVQHVAPPPPVQPPMVVMRIDRAAKVPSSTGDEAGSRGGTVGASYRGFGPPNGKVMSMPPAPAPHVQPRLQPSLHIVMP